MDQSPLYAAVLKGHAEVCRCRSDADDLTRPSTPVRSWPTTCSAKRNILLDMKNVYGQTVLFLTCAWRSMQIVELLLVNYADKNVADLNGVHPFVCERVVQGRF